MRQNVRASGLPTLVGRDMGMANAMNTGRAFKDAAATAVLIEDQVTVIGACDGPKATKSCRQNVFKDGFSTAFRFRTYGSAITRPTVPA
jgi:hypothetical protein